MDIIKININKIYEKLFDTYSNQDWWPTSSYRKDKLDTNYSYFDNTYSQIEIDRFEVIIGAILTQNTNWNNVDRSLSNLSRFTDFNPINILNFIEDDCDKFKQLIRPSGYFNQKTNYIKNISNFFIDLNGEVPSRSELLMVKGVGEETADSILLYAYNEKEFVVDAYTKRIFSYLGFFKENSTYFYVKKLFEDNFNGNVNDYKEYHALIVEHGKNYYRLKHYGVKDKLLNDYKII